MKFQIGDKVKVVKFWDAEYEEYRDIDRIEPFHKKLILEGIELEIIAIHEHDPYPYVARIVNGKQSSEFNRREIKLSTVTNWQKELEPIKT